MASDVSLSSRASRGAGPEAPLGAGPEVGFGAGPVGIVGAGPVGMTLAARLADFGVPSIIFERDPALRRQGSKACLVQGDALEVLDRFGVAQAVNERGLTWNVGHTYVRDREVRTDVHPIPVGYGPFVNISQWDVECALLRHLETVSTVQIRWGHTVTGLSQGEHGVTVRTDCAGEVREYAVSWLIACDGVRSTVRELVGATWTGYTHADRFLITDLRCALPRTKERHFYYDPPFNPGRQVVMHPQPDEVWRIDWQLPTDTDVEAEVASGEFDRRVRRVIGDIDYRVEWRSTYRFHQRVVDQFRIGRVFFAGDAAHAFPPYGSRGMNSGFQDADNLAWKLALVRSGQAPGRLLDSYHDERYAAAQENLRVTEQTLAFMVPPTRIRHLARKVALALTRVSGGVRARIDSGKMAEPFTYRSELTWGDHPLVGRFAPDGLVDTPSGPRRIRTFYGHGFVVVRHLGDRDVPAPAGRDHLLILDVRTGDLGVGPGGELPPGEERGEAGLPGAGSRVIVTDRTGVLDGYRLPAGCWALIRPDGHVAATGALDDLDLPAALARACGGIPIASLAAATPSRPDPAVTADLVAAERT